MKKEGQFEGKERKKALPTQELSEDAEPDTPPAQFTPPVLDFDALYLYPTEVYDKNALEYQAYLKDRQNYFADRARREQAEARDANASARLAEAEHQDLTERTRRANELHSQQLQEQKNLFDRTIQANKDLQQQASEAQRVEKAAVATAKKAQERVRHVQTQFYRNAAFLCCSLTVLSGSCFYRAGYIHGYKEDLEAQLTRLQTEKQDMTAKIAALEADVARLNPPPPALTAEEAEAQLGKQYHEMDEAQNEEDASRLFALYAPKYVVETDRFTNNLTALKATLRQELFQSRVIHQQTSRIDGAPSPPDASRLQNRVEHPSSSDNTASQSNDASDAAGKTEPSPVAEVLDNDTVRVPVVRELFKWTRVRVWAPAHPTSLPESDAHETEPSKTPPPLNVPLYMDHNTEQVYHQSDTWHRAQGRWRLVKSEVHSISETISERYLPTLKCRNIQCGQYYITGVDKPLSEKGEATKTCPHCGRKLYIAEYPR